MNANIFELAARQKYRFESAKGLLSAEDLWDLPLSGPSKANLDDIAKNLHRQLKSDDDFSFVTPVVSTQSGLREKFDIVKHIIDVRIFERDARNAAAAAAAQKQKILEIIARKQDGALENASLEELQKMVAGL